MLNGDTHIEDGRRYCKDSMFPSTQGGAGTMVYAKVDLRLY